ncbi:MAG: copper transporter [Firmicutes bacterium]|nr:copper transporter [Bacillota bacterium]
MINIKYYVFLMIGIFLALGLGMMIGITLENEDIIQNQQTQIAKQIEDRFIALRSETDQLKDNLEGIENQRDQLQMLSNMLLKETVQHKLSGLNITLISFDKEAPIKELLDFLPLTGAYVQSNIFLSNLIPDVFASDIAASVMQNEKELVTALISDFLYSMNFGGITPLIQEMQELKLISNTGGYEAPADVLILLGRGNITSNYDVMLINSALESGLPVIAVECGDVSDSAIDDYKAYGISTIDHIDTIYGKLALASVLSGNQGNFGLGNEAQALIPDPLFIDYNQLPLDDVISTDGGEPK